MRSEKAIRFGTVALALVYVSPAWYAGTCFDRCVWVKPESNIGISSTFRAAVDKSGVMPFAKLVPVQDATHDIDLEVVPSVFGANPIRWFDPTRPLPYLAGGTREGSYPSWVHRILRCHCIGRLLRLGGNLSDHQFRYSPHVLRGKTPVVPYGNLAPLKKDRSARIDPQRTNTHSGPLVCGAEPRARCGFHLVQLASHDTQLKSGQDGIKTCSYCDHHGGLTHPFVPHRWLRCRTLGYFLFCVGFCGICLGWSLLIPLDDWRGHKRLVLGLVLLLLFSALATHIGIGILID